MTAMTAAVAPSDFGSVFGDGTIGSGVEVMAFGGQLRKVFVQVATAQQQQKFAPSFFCFGFLLLFFLS